MTTPRERALSHLYGLREVGAPVDAAARALHVAGLLSDGETERWLGGLPDEVAPDGAAEVAAQLLEDLLSRVPPDDEGLGAELNRFEGALHAFAKIGAADHSGWDERLRERLGAPTAAEEERIRGELNAGGTEQELRAVLAGPDEVDGVRLLYALRFTDGVSIVIRRPVSDWEEDGDFWERELELRDDVGTGYLELRGSSDGEEHRLTFRPGPPDEASWLELTGIGSAPLRVLL